MNFDRNSADSQETLWAPQPPDVINLSKTPINSILFLSNDMMRKLKNLTVSS